MEDKELFAHLKSQKGNYTARAHLAEMIALLGPPPQKLIDQEKLWRDIPWDRSFPDTNGEWYNTARKYYGGPFFDSKGKSTIQAPACQAIALIHTTGYFACPEIIPTHVKLDNCITCIAGEEKALFLNFVRKTLQWLPEDRKTAKELREDPWLQLGLD